MRHAAFLSEQRKDPVTKELLVAGMEIVICAQEQIAFQADTWTGSCPLCHGSDTLPDVPNSQAFQLRSARYPFRSRPASTPFRPARNFHPAWSFNWQFWKNLLAFLLLLIVAWKAYSWLKPQLEQGFPISIESLRQTVEAGLSALLEELETVEPMPVMKILPEDSLTQEGEITQEVEMIQEDEMIQEAEILAPTEPPPTDSPVIRQRLACGVTHLSSGMDAFVQAPIQVFSIPRFQPAKGAQDPEVWWWAETGEKVNLLPHVDSPRCYHNSLFWYVVSYESGWEGWMLEWYTPHAKDQRSFAERRYLEVTPP